MNLGLVTISVSVAVDLFPTDLAPEHHVLGDQVIELSRQHFG